MSELIIALMGLALVMSYAVGINQGVSIERKKEPSVPTINKLFTNLGTKLVKTPESEKYSTILKNLDAYDGTSEGQVEIKDL